MARDNIEIEMKATPAALAEIAALAAKLDAGRVMLVALRLAKKVRENPNRTTKDHAAVGRALDAAITAAEVAGIKE